MSMELLIPEICENFRCGQKKLAQNKIASLRFSSHKPTLTMAAENSAEDVDAEHRPASTTFESLGLDSWLVQALSAMSIKRPTPIQATCIGPILEGRNHHADGAK